MAIGKGKKMDKWNMKYKLVFTVVCGAAYLEALGT